MYVYVCIYIYICYVRIRIWCAHVLQNVDQLLERDLSDDTGVDETATATRDATGLPRTGSDGVDQHSSRSLGARSEGNSSEGENGKLDDGRCVYVCMYVCMYVYVCVCMHTRSYSLPHIHTHIHAYIITNAHPLQHTQGKCFCDTVKSPATSSRRSICNKLIIRAAGITTPTRYE